MEVNIGGPQLFRMGKHLTGAKPVAEEAQQVLRHCGLRYIVAYHETEDRSLQPLNTILKHILVQSCHNRDCSLSLPDPLSTMGSNLPCMCI